MQYNPTERLSAIDGLTHPYCAQFFPQDSEPELAATRVVTSFADPTLSEDKKRDTHYYREQVREPSQADACVACALRAKMCGSILPLLTCSAVCPVGARTHSLARTARSSIG